MKFILVLALATFALHQATAHAAPWQTHYETALAQAREQNKPVLLLFTGSDWCHWCQKLERELFTETFVSEKLIHAVVPVRIDFPQRDKLPPKLRRYNQTLKVRFTIEAYPTVIVLDPHAETELLRHSYTSLSPDAYLSQLQNLPPPKSVSERP